MVDLISRSEAVEILRARAEMMIGKPKVAFFAAANMLEKLPAVEAVQVVRCRDCAAIMKAHRARVTTLNTIEILEVSRIGIASCIIILACGFFMFFGLMIYDGLSRARAIAMFIIAVFGISTGFFGALNFAENDAWKNKTGRFQIEATISDDMPFNSIYDNYKIIEKRGDIYLLEPKVFDLQQENEAE